MKFEQQTFKSMSLDELYNILKPSIDKLFKEYNYMQYSTTDFKELIINSLDLIQSNLIKINDNAYLKKYLRNIINQDVSKKILSENGYRYVVRYIEQNIHVSSDYTETLKQFKKVSNFFIKINCNLTLELLIDVLKNSTQINQMLQDIVDKNIKIIQSNHIELLFDNEISVLFINAYCMLNQLTISDEDNNDIDDEYKESINCNEDIVKMYLGSLSTKLLTIEEEKELAIRIEQGDKQARNLMITYNLKLVVNIAKRYLNRGLDFSDLIQEGNAGLMKAVDNYDVSKGYKFSTYATWWIRQSITRAIYNLGRNVRLPVHYYDKFFKYNKAVTFLTNKLNRDPTLEEISDYLCISIQEVNKLYRLQKDTISINSKVDDDENTELSDFISDEKESPEEYFINKNISNEIRELLIKCKLPERMNDVLIYRYGLDGSEPKTLEEIGQILKITKERVRQIESKALEKIKLSPYIEDFVIYMQNPDRALDSIKEFRDNHWGKIPKNTKQTKNGDNIMSKKLQTIYELLSEYPKELIDIVINDLDDKDKSLMLLCYGEDLKNPVRSKSWNQRMNNNFYGNLLRRIKRSLDKLVLMQKKNKLQTIYELLNTYSKEQVDAAINLLNDEDRLLLVLANGTDFEHPVRNNKWNSQYEDKYFKELIPKLERLVKVDNSLGKSDDKGTSNINQDVASTIDSTNNSSKESIIPVENKLEVADDYLNILKMLKTPIFHEVMNELSAKEAVIVSLKLGYVDEKYFSNESIANFLQIDPDEVTATIKRVLLTYKDYINKYLDAAIKLTDENKKIYKK